MKTKQLPDFSLERELYAHGYRMIAGIDEVGRGCLAGPVVAAAVILPADETLIEPGGALYGICDSKMLSTHQRDHLVEHILQHAISTGIGVMPPDLIDHINIYHATRLAMMAALAELCIAPDFLLLDAMHLPAIALPQRGIIRGDATSASIAAASIVAKVTRDALMVELEAEYPGYGFCRHKGYGTAQHLAALDRLGACPHHRMTFAPVARVAAKVVTSE